jgi:glucokinase
MILAGDIGGTSTRLGLVEIRDGRLHFLAENTFRSREYPGLGDVVARFLAENNHNLNSACFGVAGPVREGRVETPNFPWVVEASSLARHLKLDSVSLLNDLEANAYGVTTLESDDFAVLNEGRPSPGNAAIISAGTGLGEAGFFWDGTRLHPFASEGGHADFAPRNELEFALLDHMYARFGRVSYERAVSGPGLFNIYQFFRDTGRFQADQLVEAAVTAGDPSAEISKAGLAGRSEICVATLDLFVSLYGAEAGNLALKMMATSGIYVGGGIAPKILSKLREPAFIRSFTDKGRLSPLLKAIPVRVILNDKTALRGAAHYAACAAGLMD